MKHSDTLLFLSPVPWQFPNRQVQYLASVLSRHVNIIFLDTFRLNRHSLTDLITSSATRRQYLRFLSKLSGSSDKLIQHPVILTLHRYQTGDHFTPLDTRLFILQLRLFSLLASRQRKLHFYTVTSFFPPDLRTLNADWIYDYYDRPHDFTSDSNNRLLRVNEAWLIRRARAVLVTSRFYLNRCRRLLKPGSADHIRLFPIGYQIQDHLSLKPGRQQPVTVGYAGALSSRLDYSLIVDIIEANPNLHFIFAGKLYDDTWIAPFPKKPASTLLKHLSQHPHVTIIKHHADPAKQAATMAQFSVGWIPYDTRIPFNRYCLPTKLLEYLAIGLPVLATPIPTLKEYPDLISIFTTPVTFRSSLKHALSQRHPEDVENRKRFARQHDLSVKAEQVIALLYPTITPVSQEPV